MSDYLLAVIFFLPAGVANLVPPLANKVPLLREWKTPLDFKQTYKGQRILGDNKTWRGLVSGTLGAMITSLLVGYFIDLGSTADELFVGFLLGSGALCGDAIESLAKRRVGIKPGDSWLPFDQLDYVIGGLVLVSFAVLLPISAIVYIVLTYFLLHLLVSYVGYLLGLKLKPV